ncbi:MAG: circadian clock protein KaiB [Oscillatoriophycideae cyanobacterium NC_groundwater_1537_Pr4_S-0.65um_50_18]|nr:circadian clock protein KaiB [Oscillatoriophycideae cyanobacterium NC_groundwater_1537_Pr4_S-0.65um_50_18]
MPSNSELPASDANLFKGIALFTPGGDLVYCIDPEKRSRWHLQLCTVLQELLGLAEPPHFLVPCYTATIDRWRDPKTQHIRTFAESSPLVLRHQALLNVLFGVEAVAWTALLPPEGVCDPLVVESYRQQFPQLWEEHDLVVRFDRTTPRSPLNTSENSTLSWLPDSSENLLDTDAASGYVLRLFVSGSSPATEQTLQILHQILEQSIQRPYTLKVINIQKHPDQAEANQITATPTLVKVWPHPVRRIVGDLTDTQKVLRILSGSDRL